MRTCIHTDVNEDMQAKDYAHLSIDFEELFSCKFQLSIFKNPDAV